MLNKIEQRKVLKGFWEHKGYDPGKITSMKDNQVYAIYMKHQKAINDYLYGRKDVYVRPTIIKSERDHWTKEEWDDYAFEERD